MSSSTYFHPVNRVGAAYFAYRDGIATTKAQDDEVQFKWNLTDWLTPGESISSAAYVDSGVTTSAKSVISPEVICTVTGLGDTIITATSSNSRTVDLRVYFLDRSGRAFPSDYA